MERQAIRRLEEKTLTPEEIENVGLALMKLEQTIHQIAKRFKLDPKDLNLDLGPGRPPALTPVRSSRRQYKSCHAVGLSPHRLSCAERHASCCVSSSMVRGTAVLLAFGCLIGPFRSAFGGGAGACRSGVAV